MKRIVCAMWLMVGLLIACGSKQQSPPAEDTGGGAAGGGGSELTACVPSGCSGTVCVEHGSEVVTTCEYKAEYDCYKTATCERQADTSCGWTQSAELTSC